uniref:MarR family winged helix-turn-helix transcriptional regulator n=1 Tax=Gemmiger formicilis TaxID=745368 RepID=UPI004028E41B
MNDRFIRLSISLARLQKVIQRIKASGMSRIELKAGHTLVLCRLAAAPEGLHFSELTERCGLDPAMISRVLAELVRSGLVEKRAESGKYNALYLLTNAGHDRAARVGAVVADVERRADEGIDPDDLATFYKVIDQLTRNLEAVDADPAEAFEPLEIQ